MTTEHEHTHDEHLTVIPKMAHERQQQHPPTSPDFEFVEKVHVAASPATGYKRWTETVPTRKRILERDAEEAIEREREARLGLVDDGEHQPRHMKIAKADVPPAVPFTALSTYLEDEARRRFAAIEQALVIEVEDAIHTYFDEMHTVTWGRGFDLITNRQAAVDHLLDVFTRVSEILARNQPEPTSEKVCREPKTVLVGPYLDRLYKYALAHDIDYVAAIKITTTTEAEYLPDLDPRVDHVYWVQPFPSDAMYRAIRRIIQKREGRG